MNSTTVDQNRGSTLAYLWGADPSGGPADDGLTYGECTEETHARRLR